MDVQALLTPGVQSLVNTILADGWAKARGALAHLWSKKGEIGQDAAAQQLERGHELSPHLQGETEGDRAQLEAHWRGYLGALAASHAGLLEAIGELAAAQQSIPQGTTVNNSNTGRVRTLVQAGDIHGDLTIEGR